MQYPLTKKILIPVLDLVFPKSCMSCGRGGSYACAPCLDAISFNQQFICGICHREIESPGLCTACPSGLIDSLVYAYHYKHPLIAEAIKMAKYDYIKDLALSLGERLAFYLSTLHSRHVLENDYDLIVPVPLHIRRERQREFNQAVFIASLVSASLNVPLVKPEVVERIRSTNPQARLLATERFDNIDKAFSVAQPEAVAGKNVLLVDDLVTTGATFQALAQALRQAGVKAVSAAAVAKN